VLIRDEALLQRARSVPTSDLLWSARPTGSSTSGDRVGRDAGDRRYL